MTPAAWSLEIAVWLPAGWSVSEWREGGRVVGVEVVNHVGYTVRARSTALDTLSSLEVWVRGLR